MQSNTPQSLDPISPRVRRLPVTGAWPQPDQREGGSRKKWPCHLHAGIIMDGNGRWAKARGWPRARGHLAGVEAVRRVVRAAPRLGVGTLTLYVFSSDNWRRPPEEVEALFGLLRTFLESERPELVRQGVRCTAIGRRDRIPPEALATLASTEAATAEGR
ncbi:MAG TPA: polyprenyl diphosphate synthase, partial [Terriglobales bacterium]|nr:polyprenyl diphosphate synthase [Terriglobales bacterium]